MDMHMVRAGVASHASILPFSAFNDIQDPRRKYILIDYGSLQRLPGFDTYDQLWRNHNGWVEEHIGDGFSGRQDQWTCSIAVGRKFIMENVKALLRFRAKGRDVIEGDGWYQLRENPVSHKTLFVVESKCVGFDPGRFMN